MNAPVETHGIIISLLRASTLPLAFKCPGSIRNTSTRINISNEAADAGSAMHKCCESLPRIGSIDWEFVDEVAAEHGCDCNELRFLCAKATRLWAKLRESFPGSITEVAIEYPIEVAGLKITGTIDGIAISGDVARLYDWKGGRLDTDYYHQMMAYGSMVLLAFPQLREVTVTILWVRHEQFENYTITREKAQEWMRKLETEVVQWDGVYHPHEKCVHCPRWYECEAANGLARASVAAIQNVDVDSIAQQVERMPPDELIQLRRTAKMVTTIAERTNDAIRALLQKRGEIVGSEAKLMLENQPKRELDTRLTWQVLERIGFDEQDYAEVSKLSVTKIEKLVAERAGRGNGAAAKRKLKADLEAAGAVEMVDTFSISERRL